MKISVIIPTYNRANFLLKTINSVFQQTIKANEIIVIDDGSTDNTKQVIQNQDITYYAKENQGVSSARNKGIELAQYDWICFIDSDDIWYTQKLEKQLNFHKQNPHILFSHTDEEWIFNKKTIKQKLHQQKKDKKAFIDHLPNTFIGASTVMIHKSIFDDIGVFDNKLKACEDYDLWLRILKRYDLGFIDEKLIQKIAGHSGQLSFETPLMDQYRIEALLKHIDSKHSDEVIKEIIKRCDILIKGAKKHNNNEVENHYSRLKTNLLSRC